MPARAPPARRPRSPRGERRAAPPPQELDQQSSRFLPEESPSSPIGRRISTTPTTPFIHSPPSPHRFRACGSFGFHGSPPATRSAVNASTRSGTDSSLNARRFFRRVFVPPRYRSSRGRLILIDCGTNTCRASFTAGMGMTVMRNSETRVWPLVADRLTFFLASRSLVLGATGSRSHERRRRSIGDPPEARPHSSDPQRADVRRRIVRLHRIARNGGKRDGVGSANRRSPPKQSEVRGTPHLRGVGGGKLGRPESEVFSNGAESFPSVGLPALPKVDPVTGRLRTVTESNHINGSLN